MWHTARSTDCDDARAPVRTWARSRSSTPGPAASAATRITRSSVSTSPARSTVNDRGCRSIRTAAAVTAAVSSWSPAEAPAAADVQVAATRPAATHLARIRPHAMRRHCRGERDRARDPCDGGSSYGSRAGSVHAGGAPATSAPGSAGRGHQDGVDDLDEAVVGGDVGARDRGAADRQQIAVLGDRRATRRPA